MSIAGPLKALTAETSGEAAVEAVVEALGQPETEGGSRASFFSGRTRRLWKNVFVRGPHHYVHSRGTIALACAIAGIAGTLLPGGTTAHSLFGLPHDMTKHDALSSIIAQEGRAEALRRAAIILWDQASMILTVLSTVSIGCSAI